MGQEILKWADQQQYHREPIPEESRRKITVSLINPPHDPLGHLVALNGIYKGEVIRSLDDPRVTDEARHQAFDDLTKTTLSGPMESIQFHFLIEGLTRSITHQMVRSRFSFFAQESLRFAVPEGDWTEEIPLPPSLEGTRAGGPSQADDWRTSWDRVMTVCSEEYHKAVNSGMPAEEAREMLPHAMPTRIHWVLDLRTLLLEAGKRTCTQAQFPWRVIFGEMARALRSCRHKRAKDGTLLGLIPDPSIAGDAWQYSYIADKIRPVCYQAGKCTFMAQFDRGCKIRERVEKFAAAGVPSTEWGRQEQVDSNGEIHYLPLIDPREWAADPSAARI